MMAHLPEKPCRFLLLNASMAPSHSASYSHLVWHFPVRKCSKNQEVSLPAEECPWKADGCSGLVPAKYPAMVDRIGLVWKAEFARIFVMSRIFTEGSPNV